MSGEAKAQGDVIARIVFDNYAHDRLLGWWAAGFGMPERGGIVICPKGALIEQGAIADGAAVRQLVDCCRVWSTPALSLRQ